MNSTQLQLAKIERDIGELRGDVRSVLRELERDRMDSKESRSRMYDRIERSEETAAISGKVAAQARDVASDVDKLVRDEIKPQTDKLKNLGIKGGGFLTGAAMVGGLASAPLWSTAASALEKLFGK